jgi:membrane protein YqaA with SNARE-associated domain
MNINFEALGLLGIFLGCFLAATLIPFSSEALVAYAISQDQNLFLVFAIALAGNYLGSVVNYSLGFKGVGFIEERFKKEKKQIDRAQQIFHKWGTPSLLLSSLPIIGDPLTFVAGLAQIPFKTFSFWVLIGKGLRYAVVIWLATSLTN